MPSRGIVSGSRQRVGCRIDPEDENAKGLFEKDSEKTCFVKTDDAWYEPIRKLGGTA